MQYNAKKITDLQFCIGISMSEKPCERMILLLLMVKNIADLT
jgi:hypothetical protein